MIARPEKDRSHAPQERQADLFEAMADQLHVDLAETASRDGEAIARAQTRCLNCNAVAECEGWLDAAFGVPLPPIFCPNAPFFHLCIADAHDDRS